MSDRAENTKIISKNIKDLRAEAGWSQAKLAKVSGVSPAAISLIENGDRIPSLVVTRKLASAFKVPEAKITGSQVEPIEQIDKEAQAFFRTYGELEELDDADKEIIKGLIHSLKDRQNDKSGK